MAILLHAGLLRQICLEPQDLLLRLVLADWLEEQGHPGADLIRVQCQRASLRCTGRGARRCRCRHCRLQRQERKLLQDTHLVRSLQPASIPDAWAPVFSCGLVVEVSLTLTEFLGHPCLACQHKSHLHSMMPIDCLVCGGRGYLNGAAERLVQEAPLQRIFLADRTASQGTWFRSPDSYANPGYIPPRLFRFLHPSGALQGYRPMGQEARAGLSDACVAYAWELAFGAQGTPGTGP